MPAVHPDDRLFVKGQLLGFPREFYPAIMAGYEKQPTRFEANTYLRHLRRDIARTIGVHNLELNMDFSEDSLKQLARTGAYFCRAAGKSAVSALFRYQKQCRIVQAHRLDFPKIPEHESRKLPRFQRSIQGAMGRMESEAWWLSGLRRRHRRDIETLAQMLGMVHKHKAIYCSDLILKKRRMQLWEQSQMLEHTSVMNQAGQRYTLKALSEKNVANPQLRKAELMVRMRGFEELSEQFGHVGLFITMTCPSRYHAVLNRSGERNPKWQTLTPLDAQNYLRTTFARIRAKLDREQVRPYGFRVAEPHHDGTPHWHLLLFVPASQKAALITTFRTYCLQEDGSEKGAENSRFKVVEIDPAKGSATGYIAKYVSKNINGQELESGVYGEDPIEAAARVDAWASCWGIRQFQQIGGASVTVWRELRRLKTPERLSETCQKIHQAADCGNWQVYTEQMGGMWCKRADRPIQPFYQLVFDKVTGECHLNQYRDSFLTRLKGILAEGREVITRIWEWKLVQTHSQNA
ncbi:MAG: hypothetical protein CENE_02285 [Candidatus Celerinatantimonas neptuna]|nr:MAG: hypothetical protein CENE_02285 [Candidatus Celerinatantimonas neptuna]